MEHKGSGLSIQFEGPKPNTERHRLGDSVQVNVDYGGGTVGDHLEEDKWGFVVVLAFRAQG